MYFILSVSTSSLSICCLTQHNSNLYILSDDGFSQITQNSSTYTNVQSFVSECLSRSRADAMRHLVLGSCGKSEYTVIGDIAGLLVAFIRTAPPNEIEPQLVAALRQDDFLLGDPSKNVALSILSRCGINQTNPLCPCDLETFLQDVWRLHQVEDTDALPLSDEVARFLQKYSN